MSVPRTRRAPISDASTMASVNRRKAPVTTAVDRYPSPHVPLAPETYTTAATKLRAWGDLDILDMLGLSEVGA